MSIGYACLTVGVPDTKQKSCMLRNATEENLMELIHHNLNVLENIIDYNINNSIKVFRISSDIIPFGSSPANQLEWWKIFNNQLQIIGRKIKDSGMRVSMHPGQYTVLNSPNEDVVKRAVQDLNYHTQLLNSLGTDTKSKIVLHIGGIYSDKESATERFIENYDQLNDSVKSRLVIENDDKSYHIGDVLKIGSKLKIPIVFDNLHHMANPYDLSRDNTFWIRECSPTWEAKDGRQKIHYSQQNPLKRKGSHSDSIRIDEFIRFYENLNGDNLDIMLEVKDKNLSAVKCINCTAKKKNRKAIELEWSRYKYKVLENSQEHYLQIRRLLRDQEDNHLAIPFYNLIEDALLREYNIGNSINAVQHVWGYFSDIATEKEKRDFFNAVEAFQHGNTSIAAIKKILWKLTVKYQQEYLLNSYYFI